MWLYKGFKTKEEATRFAEGRKSARICYEKSDIESRGKNVLDYRRCSEYGLSIKLPYAVIWEC